MDGEAREHGPYAKTGTSIRIPPLEVIDNLLVRNHFIIVMVRWTGLAPWGVEFPFPGSLTSTFQCRFEFVRGQRPPHAEEVKGVGPEWRVPLGFATLPSA